MNTVEQVITVYFSDKRDIVEMLHEMRLEFRLFHLGRNYAFRAVYFVKKKCETAHEMPVTRFAQLKILVKVN